MEGLQKAYRSAMSQAQESKVKLSSFASSLEKTSLNSNSSSGSSIDLSADKSQLLLTRSSRQSVSLWTCSKLCTICFIAGVLVGYTLKRRVRLWASKLLKRLHND
ncbi:uncharacterized protein LOC111381633 [Olea europaea subsp. europaea]|uniref:Uncharacterized protein LOC111381633 n=1 Tax=Olea europaea subsp. europaea TaxID=158383 RepID=A0A8S0RKW3_OLEEU|nr:uncharacterized protein LOC111381633 [Olea europaea subsp. europaea]